MTVLGNQYRLYNKHLCLSIQEVLPEHLLHAKPWTRQDTMNMLNKRKKKWIRKTNFARGLARHLTSCQCMVRTQEKTGSKQLVTAGWDCGQISGDSHITLREQVCAVKFNTHMCLGEAKSSPKPDIEKNLLDCSFSLLCPANVFPLRSNTISWMKPLLASSLGKLAISSSVHQISFFIPLYHSINHTALS